MSAGKYGTYGLIQSGEVKDIKFAELKDINESMHGQDVIIFAFQFFIGISDLGSWPDSCNSCEGQDLLHCASIWSLHTSG